MAWHDMVHWIHGVYFTVHSIANNIRCIIQFQYKSMFVHAGFLVNACSKINKNLNKIQQKLAVIVIHISQCQSIWMLKCDIPVNWKLSVILCYSLTLNLTRNTPILYTRWAGHACGKSEYAKLIKVNSLQRNLGQWKFSCIF